MNGFSCWLQNVSKLTIGVLFMFMGLAAVAIGLTVLPIIGLIMAVPVFGLAFYFIRAHLNRECEITD
jgi:hypothetical protein